jgi:Tfp pilus assembly protein PilV
VRKLSAGFNLVEAVIAVTIAASFILALSSINTNYVRAAFGHEQFIRASFLAEEGMEATRYMRDESWSSRIAPLAVGVDYYLYWGGSYWQATTTPTNIAGYDRRIRFEEVMRDSGNNISVSGTLDPGTKLVTSQVSWQDHGATTTRSISGYISDIFDN